MAKEKKNSAKSASAQGPKIRLNSNKVTRLDKADFEEARPQSKFSQWRAQREAAARVSATERSTEKPHNVAVLDSATSGAQAQTGFASRSTFKKWGVRIGGLAVVALLFIGLVFYSPLLAIRTVTVQGTSLLQQSAVQDSLSALEGKPLTRVSDSEVADLVGNSDKIRNISVEAKPPHELVVTIQERVPIAVVKDGDSAVLVDAEGKQLGDIKSSEDVDLPLVDGGTSILNSAEFSTVASVLEALPADLLAQVKEAKADSASTISLTMNDGTSVVWGTAEDSELKAKVLAKLRSAVGESGSVSTYDVSSPLVPTTK